MQAYSLTEATDKIRSLELERSEFEEKVVATLEAIRDDAGLELAKAVAMISDGHTSLREAKPRIKDLEMELTKDAGARFERMLVENEEMKAKVKKTDRFNQTLMLEMDDYHATKEENAALQKTTAAAEEGLAKTKARVEEREDELKRATGQTLYHCA